MSNVTNTPNLPQIGGALWAPVQKELSWFEKYVQLFKAHERAIIVVLVLGFGAHMYGRWIDLEGNKANAQVVALTQTVAQDKQSVANLALQASQANAAFQTTLDAMTRQNQALAQANAQETALLTKNRAVDATLPLPQLGQRLQALVPAATGVTATSTGLSLDSTSSVAVVQQLEQIPVLVDELKNETQVAANNKSALDAAGTVITDKTAQIVGLNKSLTDQQAHEVAAVAAEKVKTKKAFIKGFKWGAITGFIGGIFTMHAL